MMKRRRFKQSISFQDRLTAFAEDAREEAEELPPGIHAAQGKSGRYGRSPE
jgi:hypothetical protein